MRDDFAVFILSHGRADRCITVKTLERGNYTGKWYILIDNEDSQESEYRRLYGEHVIQFDKMARFRVTDTMDASEDRKIVVCARNECFVIAKKMGLKYFLELDDDYDDINYPYVAENKLKRQRCKNLDGVFEAMIEFLRVSNADTVTFAQGGDFIGGKDNRLVTEIKVKRKPMNSFFMDVDKPFEFLGATNEDVNAYVLLGKTGWLGMLIADVAIDQMTTQTNAGGLTDIYLQNGTYVKSFYSVIARPDCVSVGLMGSTHMRMHHSIEWDYCVPKIVSDRWKKGGNGENEDRTKE